MRYDSVSLWQETVTGGVYPWKAMEVHYSFLLSSQPYRTHAEEDGE